MEQKYKKKNFPTIAVHFYIQLLSLIHLHTEVCFGVSQFYKLSRTN